jgi:hypothetical protein
MLDLAKPKEAVFLAGGGEMGARMRHFDWSATAIGAPEGWSAALKLALRLLLDTNHPMLIWWGPDLIQFYNDNFSQMVGPDLGWGNRISIRPRWSRRASTSCCRSSH